MIFRANAPAFVAKESRFAPRYPSKGNFLTDHAPARAV
jgi:hypothetical protein